MFIDEIDEETNLPKSEKRLSTIQTIQNGKPVGSMWTFALNGMKIYQKDPEHAEAIIFYVPDERLVTFFGFDNPCEGEYIERGVIYRQFAGSL